jgi:hypothetical protein
VLGLRDPVIQSPQPIAHIPQNSSAGGQPGSFGVGIPHNPSLVSRENDLKNEYPRDRLSELSSFADIRIQRAPHRGLLLQIYQGIPPVCNLTGIYRTRLTSDRSKLIYATLSMHSPFAIGT